MPNITPHQVIDAIDSMFGPNRNELDFGAITTTQRSQVQTLLILLDQIPSELLTFSPSEYLEYNLCRATLHSALQMWLSTGQGPVAQQVHGRDAVALLRRLLGRCPEELPPRVNLAFIGDQDRREWIEERAKGAWISFGSGEWLGCTVLAGSALEALLLWALKEDELLDECPRAANQPALEELNLAQLISRARAAKHISESTAAQAQQAKDARNLVHPGRVARLGRSASRGTALAALAALDQVIESLASRETAG